MQEIIQFFNHPFFMVFGGAATLATIIGMLYTGYLIMKGILPVWYRLGIGLSKREIAIFAEEEFDNLKNLLVDSKIINPKNIVKIDRQSIKKAGSISMLLVHWKCFAAEIDQILNIKDDTDALVIYAPQHEGFIDKPVLEKINKERNCIIVNFRGRLLNDILVSMITTSFTR